MAKRHLRACQTAVLLNIPTVWVSRTVCIMKQRSFPTFYQSHLKKLDPFDPFKFCETTRAFSGSLRTILLLLFIVVRYTVQIKYWSFEFIFASVTSLCECVYVKPWSHQVLTTWNLSSNCCGGRRVVEVVVVVVALPPQGPDQIYRSSASFLFRMKHEKIHPPPPGPRRSLCIFNQSGLLTQFEMEW